MKLTAQPHASATSPFGIGMSPEGSRCVPLRGEPAACDPRVRGGYVCARGRSSSGVLVARALAQPAASTKLSVQLPAASSEFGVSSRKGSLRVRMRGGSAAWDLRVWGGFVCARARSRSGVFVARARAPPLPPAETETAFFNSSGASEDDALNIDLIRQSLTRQEIVIFYNFLERSELPLNLNTYSLEACKVSGFSGTLLEFVMQETEKAHARAGRYKRKGELPFFGSMLLEPVLPLYEYQEVLHPNAASINLNDVIWELYFSKILPKLAKKGSDGNNGSSAVCDTKTLQALSQRVHYSMFLAEAKFRESPDCYEAAIKDQDAEKLREVVKYCEMDEAKHRAENRIEAFGLLVNQGDAFKRKVESAGQLFDKYVAPLIIEVQVQYLLLKGCDDNYRSSQVRKTIRLRALSKTRQLLVRAGPPFAYFAKIGAILSIAVMVAVRDKILEFLNSRGVVLDKATLAAVAICLLSVKGAYDALKKGEEVVELAKYYAKLLEKDKK